VYLPAEGKESGAIPVAVSSFIDCLIFKPLSGWRTGRH